MTRHPNASDAVETAAVAFAATVVHWWFTAEQPLLVHAGWFVLAALLYTPFCLGLRGLRGLRPRLLLMRLQTWNLRRLERAVHARRGGESFL